MRAQEVVRLTEGVDALAKLVGKGLYFRLAAGRQADNPAQNGKDVLDPVAELLGDKLALLRRQPCFVDIGASADPAENLATLVADRNAAPKGPAELSVAMPDAVLDLV